MMKNKMYTVSESDLLDVLNMLTYDYYASLQRRLWRAGIKRRPLFIEYYTECKRHLDLTSFDPTVWYAGYQFIADLFDDNERHGTPCDEEARYEQSIDLFVALVNRRH